MSHKLDEVYKLCSRAVVLRDGKSVGGGPLPALGRDALVTLMVGRELTALYPPKLAAVESGVAPALVVEDLRVRRYDAHAGKAPEVHGVSFTAYPGEILGLGGMMGSGRTELLYGIFGHPDYTTTGRVMVAGRDIPRGSIAAMVASKVGLVTEDRKATGLHLGLTIRENVSMASLAQVASGGFLREGVERTRAQGYATRLRIKAPSTETVVGTLSGGNQQKVAIAKWAALPPKVLMLDEPTRGVDVGAKFEIYQLLRELAASGVAVVVASSEIPELIGICHRVLILREGRLAGALEGGEVTAENILRRAIGGRP